MNLFKKDLYKKEKKEVDKELDKVNDILEIDLKAMMNTFKPDMNYNKSMSIHRLVCIDTVKRPEYKKRYELLVKKAWLLDEKKMDSTYAQAVVLAECEAISVLCDYMNIAQIPFPRFFTDKFESTEYGYVKKLYHAIDWLSTCLEIAHKTIPVKRDLEGSYLLVKELTNFAKDFCNTFISSFISDEEERLITSQMIFGCDFSEDFKEYDSLKDSKQLWFSLSAVCDDLSCRLGGLGGPELYYLYIMQEDYLMNLAKAGNFNDEQKLNTFIDYYRYKNDLLAHHKH